MKPVSSLMAMLLQALCARVGIATGRDLAQLCRDRFPRPVNLGLWALAEVAIFTGRRVRILVAARSDYLAATA